MSNTSSSSRQPWVNKANESHPLITLIRRRLETHSSDHKNKDMILAIREIEFYREYFKIIYDPNYSNNINPYGCVHKRINDNPITHSIYTFQNSNDFEDWTDIPDNLKNEVTYFVDLNILNVKSMLYLSDNLELWKYMISLLSRHKKWLIKKEKECVSLKDFPRLMAAINDTFPDDYESRSNLYLQIENAVLQAFTKEYQITSIFKLQDDDMFPKKGRVMWVIQTNLDIDELNDKLKNENFVVMASKIVSNCFESLIISEITDAIEKMDNDKVLNYSNPSSVAGQICRLINKKFQTMHKSNELSDLSWDVTLYYDKFVKYMLSNMLYSKIIPKDKNDPTYDDRMETYKSILEYFKAPTMEEFIENDCIDRNNSED